MKLPPGFGGDLRHHRRGLDDLLTAISDRLRAVAEVVELVVPYDRGDVLAALHREGEVVERARRRGIRVCARLSRPSVGRLAEYVVRETSPESGRPDR